MKRTIAGIIFLTLFTCQTAYSASPGKIPIASATIIQSSAKEAKGAADDSIAINFEGVDLMSLLRYLSQETDRGFIVDQGLTGNITIISPVRLSKSEALATLESILQVKGFAAIPSGKMFKIVPLAQAKVAGTVTRTGKQLSNLSEDDTLVTQIIPLAKIAAEEAKQLLTPLLPPDCSIMTFLPSNTLIVTGRSINIKRAVEVMKELEKGRVRAGLEIIPVEFSNVSYLKGQIDSLLNVGGLGKGDLKGGLMVFPDQRTNALMIVSAKENFPFIRDLIKKLDTESNDKRPEMSKIFTLKYADEGETIKLIQDILGLGRKTGKDGGGPVASETQAMETTRLLPVKRTKSIIAITRSLEVLEKIEKILKDLDCRPPRENSGVKVVRLAHSDAKTMAEILTNLAQTKSKTKTTQKPENINFVAVPENNAILITSSHQLFAQYQPIIKSLDVMRPQIMVEALIAEVSGNISKSLGIEWGIINPEKTGLHAFGGTNYGMRSEALTGQGFQVGLVEDAMDVQKIKDGDFTEYSKIKALVGLYQNNANFNILSAPTILTTDNEEAKIMVGEVVALPQGFTKDRDSGRFDLTNFKYEDVGINLAITPRVNSGAVVSMKIDQEIKKRQEENLYQFNVPVLTKRKMTTSVTVPNHRTIVIGGLVREDKSVVVDKVPFFANIPIIGEAFKNRRRAIQKTNLLVFLTPHILSTPDEVAKFDSSEYSRSQTSEKPKRKNRKSDKVKNSENITGEKAISRENENNKTVSVDKKISSVDKQISVDEQMKNRYENLKNRTRNIFKNRSELKDKIVSLQNSNSDIIENKSEKDSEKDFEKDTEKDIGKSYDSKESDKSEISKDFFEDPEEGIDPDDEAEI
ncbi:MAG: hypothetical protein HQM10_20535 [Candidatus Riflebacteria bacterium]|nr:hypothetical protein [Candidatus Riflebacteria bacterium]